MQISNAGSRINGLQLSDVSIQSVGEMLAVKVNYALLFVARSGMEVTDVTYHGSCSAGRGFSWSAQTWKLLQELVRSLEKDLMTIHFKEEPNGFLAEEEAPQV